MVTSLLFYLFASTLLLSAVAAVSIQNPVYAVLFVILCFFNTSGLFLMMGAEFLGFILLIVYVGAVAVLFLFVVMMLDVHSGLSLNQKYRRYIPAACIVGFVLLFQLVAVTSAWIVDPKALSVLEASSDTTENVRALGKVLYTDYFFPMQIAGVILLVAMVGAIVLTLRGHKDSRRQCAACQVGVLVKDVVELKNVPSKQGVEL